MDYTLGFAFDGVLRNVVLIRKTKPLWQKGLLNGVGGKVEPSESESSCMAREFREETGIDIPKHRWTNYGRMLLPGGSGYVYLYYTVDQFAYDNVLTTTDEEVVRLHVTDAGSVECINNLVWLIPAALSHYKHNDFRLEAMCL